MKIRITGFCAGVLVAAACATAPAMAQTPGTAAGAVGPRATAPPADAAAVTRGRKALVSKGDRDFIVKAAAGGLFEVQASQLAMSKATDPAVKSFASMLADHHGAANNELAQLARAKGVEMPAAPERGMRRMIDTLGKLSGAGFDQRYVREVGIKDHENDIKLFEKGSKNVKDAQLKAWIDKTLPTLREHLAQAGKLPQAARKG